MRFEDFFEKATGSKPYPYQLALATADALPAVVIAPTGAGKTAAAILAWLYRRRFAGNAVRNATPRRLVFCLPMRTLVDQTAQAARVWLSNLGLLDEARALARGEGVAVAVLLGGDTDEDWFLHPEREAVIVGTQDMLLSRALNRGYASNRFHWPWDFGLLSSDSLWVFDEVQLMGVGLTTGLQLAGLRRSLGTYGPSASLFMSATLDPAWLSTIDHPDPGSVLSLSARDLQQPDLAKRREAAKRLSRFEAPHGRDWGKRIARLVAERHVARSRTLVVVNTVDRATEAFVELRKLSKVDAVLLHSRFRLPDRATAVEKALQTGFDGVVVSTQVIEAGVDISSRTLITELAPWASLVQRAGRCNRAGELAGADVVWLDYEIDDKTSLPYSTDELQMARKHLLDLVSFNPEAIEQANVELVRPELSNVLRRRDLEDLFDTTPDLAGYDVDVSRFIRDGEERDVQVFWRVVSEVPPPTEPRPQRHELCSVPFLRFRDWLSKERKPAWRWNHLDRAWERAAVARVAPGAVFLLDADGGGYEATLGWAPSSDAGVTSLLESRIEKQADAEEAQDDDPNSQLAQWVTLQQHALDTRDEASEIASRLHLHDVPSAIVIRAAHAHDLGKAHEVFQHTMRNTGAAADSLWAKSKGKFSARHKRRGFRHELASALMWLQRGPQEDRDLIAYLLAAHHGKVRLSIRALPNDAVPPEPERLHARGVWDGDEVPVDHLPEVDLADGLVLGRTPLSLAPMALGGGDGAPSWTSRVLALRAALGPFRLAFLEALVRAADVRASKRRDSGVIK